MTRPIRGFPKPSRGRGASCAVLLAVVLALAAPLAGCGKKGELEPPDKDSTYPRTYPTSR